MQATESASPTAPAPAPGRFPRPLSLAAALSLAESTYAGPVPVRIPRPSRSKVVAFLREAGYNSGWVLFFGGEVCGWLASFEVCRMSSWRPGVVAVAANSHDKRVFLAVGGNYQDGAKRFQFIDPVGF